MAAGVPHFLIFCGLQIVARVAVISWLAILLTGRLPEGLANCCASTSATTTVPWRTPASCRGVPAVRHDGPGPRQTTRRCASGSRRRSRTVSGSRWASLIILAIPQLVVAAVSGIAAFVAWVIGFFAVLFTGRWPKGLRTFVVGYMRWRTRVEAHVGLLTDEDPPLSLE